MNFSRPDIASGQRSKASSSPSLQMAVPRVSVIVTCFNYDRFVTQALDSVASQTYKNFDCIIVDDASTDDSVRTVQQWIDDRKDVRFHLIRNPSNSGQMASFTAGLAASSGEFVAFLDADDFWLPAFLQRHVEAHLNRSFFVPVSCSDMVQIDEERRMLSGTWVGSKFEEKTGPLFPAIDAEHSVRIDPGSGGVTLIESPEVKYINPSYLDHPWSVTSGMMFRRSALDFVMPKEPGKLRICADGYVFIFCHYFGGSLAIGSALGAYRRHGANNFSNNPVLGTLPSSPSVIERHQRTIVGAMIDHLLDRYDDVAALFSDASARGFAGILYRKALQYDVPIRNSRLRKILGRRRVLEYRIKTKLTFLARMAPWWRALTRADP